jgi:single-stranded-DNA-specific exonuclease
MRAEVIEEAARNGIRLVISVDTGIRAVEAVTRARELGIDVIVTDHHLPEAGLPPALAVLNPNQPGCPYPEKALCGAGVAFKLAQALFRTLTWPPARARKVLESFLKIVAIATVADVVPLTGENRVIVKQGLEGLRDVRNTGLKALMEVAGFAPGDRPTAGQVAFRIAPRINAAGRMATASDVIELFLTADEPRARAIAAQLHTLNQERQQTEEEIRREILEACEHTPVGAADFGLVFSGPGWHRGVIGIVASRLVERFHRPVIVLGEDPDSGDAQGSGRSIPGFHLLEALEAMPELFTRFGGHRQAAGLTLPIARVEEFRRRFNAYAAERLDAAELRPRFAADVRLELDEINDHAIEEILSLAPFGYGNPAPVFLLENLEVMGEPVVWKERNLRLRFRRGGSTLMVKAWNFAERLEEFTGGSTMDALVTFEEDTYSRNRGYAGWGAVLKDVRPQARAAGAF